MAQGKRQILLVLGMHRSGTSFLAEAIGTLGFTLPKDRSGPSADNLKGHFEPLGVVALNDDILLAAGGDWKRLGVLPDLARQPGWDFEGVLDQSFGASDKLVLKDPRLSLTLPLWRDALEADGVDLKAVIALRHPWAVVGSLQRRDGMHPEMGLALWVRYTLAALLNTQSMDRLLVSFPEWLDAAEQTVAALARLTGVDGVDPAKVIAGFERNALHEAPTAKGEATPMAALALDMFDRLSALAAAQAQPDAAEIDTWQARFEAQVELASAFEQELAKLIAGLANDRDDILAQREAAEVNAARQAEGAMALQKHVKAVEGQSAELQDILTRLQREHQELAEDFNDVEADRQEQLAQKEALAGDLRIAKNRVDDLQHRLEIERMTILKPIYRRLYRSGGRIARRVLPNRLVEGLRRHVPGPGSIPADLSYTSAAQAGTEVALPDIPPAAADKSDIFVMSIINWDFRTQRPQHLASQMAAKGHRVFFVEMDREAGGTSVRAVGGGVYVVRLATQGLRDLQNYSGVPTKRQARAWIQHFYALTDSVATQGVAQIVVEHPYWWNFAKHLSPQYQITFDCMDEIAGFSNTEQHILDAEAELIAKADKMIVSSQYLYDKYKDVRPVRLVRNGTDVGHFVNAPDNMPVPGFLNGKLAGEGIKVGYVGAIAEWFDVDLLEAVAKANPDFDIHLCGAVTAEAPLRLKDVENITLHGEIPYQDVPAFHQTMDVLLIPFQLLPIIKACDPVKFYEYSAMKTPTVSTSLPELERAGDLVFTADAPAEFAEAIRKAATALDTPGFADRLLQYALDNAWQYRAEDILAEIDQEPKVSVVVLSYGDPTLTLTTLASLVDHGPVYPNLEILLVDNGSPEDALSQLRAKADLHPEIRLIENGENLGFAKGNNVGIEAATGEYVLLLNNDTFVAPNSIVSMVRHLQAHPDVGIVGPMTNNIGNEAKVDLAYDDMDAMVLAARDLTTGYRGQNTPMPVAAYFCAMMRKADLDRIGLLPEEYGRGMFEDDDHCASFRKAGFDIRLAEDAFVHHHLSASFDAIPSQEKQDLFAKNKAIFEDRWGPWTPHEYRTERPAGTL